MLRRTSLGETSRPPPIVDFSRIPRGNAPPCGVNVIVEIPQGGGSVEYEFDKETGALKVDGALPISSSTSKIAACAILGTSRRRRC